MIISTNKNKTSTARHFLYKKSNQRNVIFKIKIFNTDAVL